MISQEHFWAKVACGSADECWLWTGTTNNHGYGYVRSYVKGEKGQMAHRMAYELVVGPIPKGLELDHLCRVPACVNPAHLEPVTHRENIRRGTGPFAERARQTHCKRGHLLSGENVIIDARGTRRCRACTKKWRRERALKGRAS